jgi:hypothetical protein
VLDGGGGSPIEFSGVVTIDGARGVTIKRLTIQNGPGEGILGRRGAAFTVQHTTVQHNAGNGIAVESSRAELTDVTMQNNAVGLDVFTGSTAILRGAITAVHNGSGIEVNGQSILEIRGAQVQVNNGGSGLIAGSSQVAIFGFTASQGSTLTADGNEFAGIIIAGPSALIVYGSQFFGSGANIITTTNNRVFGIFLANGGSIQSPFGTGKFVIEHNPTGVNIVDSSVAVIDGGLNVKNNGTGLLANGAGTLTLRTSAKPSAITGNRTDVDLQFGTRATFDGVTIGTIVCDTTVLSRDGAGNPVCP